MQSLFLSSTGRHYIISTHQSLDPGLKLLLGSIHGLLGAEDGDDLAVLVLLPREDDPCSSLVPDLLHVRAVATDQELVVLGLGPNLRREGREGLLVG